MRAFTVSLLVVLSLTAAPHADSALDVHRAFVADFAS